MENLITLREVAKILGVSEQRVYQMDTELHPSMTKRGDKMVTRHYVPAIVEVVRIKRARFVLERAQVISAPEPLRVAWFSLLEQAGRETLPVMLTIDELTHALKHPCETCGGSHPCAPLISDGARAVTAETVIGACQECILAKGSRSIREFIDHAVRVARADGVA